MRKKDKQGSGKKRWNKFGYTGELKHSKMGVRSCIYAGIALFCLLGSILISFLMRGKAAFFIGLIGISAAVLSGVGISIAIKGMKERNKRYVTCKIGLVCNILLVCGLIMIFVGGF